MFQAGPANKCVHLDRNQFINLNLKLSELAMVKMVSSDMNHPVRGSPKLSDHGTHKIREPAY